MKKLILNFETKSSDFKELVQEAFNKDILNFLISNETYSEFEKIERVNIYSKNLDLTPKFGIYTDKEKLMEKVNQGKIESSLGFYIELKSKEDEREIVNLSKTGQVDFIIVSE